MNDQANLDDFMEKSVHVNGVRLAYFERGLSHLGKRPTLLFVHATGFHARLWDKIVREFPDYHVISLDQRGHGRSENVPLEHWSECIDDLVAFIVALDLNNIAAIGHSMGGHAIIGAAGREEARFAGILAIDPVIAAESDYAAEIPAEYLDVPHPTSRRRREFDTPEEMAEWLKPKGSFGLFEPEILMDYCRHGLLPNETGKGYVLACPPEIEASIYMASRSNRAIYDAVRSIETPVVVVRAREAKPGRDVMDFASSPTWPGLAGEFKNGTDLYYPDMTHFLPMQAPAEVVRLIKQTFMSSE